MEIDSEREAGIYVNVRRENGSVFDVHGQIGVPEDYRSREIVVVCERFFEDDGDAVVVRVDQNYAFAANRSEASVVCVDFEIIRVAVFEHASVCVVDGFDFLSDDCEERSRGDFDVFGRLDRVPVDSEFAGVDERRSRVSVYAGQS